MKKVLILAAAAASLTLVGCAKVPYQGGAVFTNMSAPLSVQDNVTACNKRGTSSSTNVLGFFATGDASIQAAKEAGGVTKVGSVDYNYTQLLGFVGKTTTIVCGE